MMIYLLLKTKSSIIKDSTTNNMILTAKIDNIILLAKSKILIKIVVVGDKKLKLTTSWSQLSIVF